MTLRQQRFVDEYLRLRNGAKAVLASGYATKRPHAIAWQLLQKPWIKAAIAARSRGEDFLPPLPRKSAGLTARQRRFADEYLAVLNAREAAERAGYAPGNAAVLGCQLLKHPGIAQIIREGVAARGAARDQRR